MARSWSDAARRAFDAYPWPDGRTREKACAEVELVAFGDAVEFDDLPLEVRREATRRARKLALADAVAAWEWRGETYQTVVDAFAAKALACALSAAHGNMTAAARALGTTPRVVAYQLRRLHLVPSAGSPDLQTET